MEGNIKYDHALKDYGDLINGYSEDTNKLFKQLLLVSSSMFAIMVSLHPFSNLNGITQLLYSISILSMVVSIVTSILAVYNQSLMKKKLAEAVRSELSTAMREGRPFKPSFIEVKGKKWNSAICWSSIISLLISVVILGSYAVLSVLSNCQV